MSITSALPSVLPSLAASLLLSFSFIWGPQTFLPRPLVTGERSPSLQPGDTSFILALPVTVCGKAACPGVCSLGKRSGMEEHETSFGP